MYDENVTQTIQGRKRGSDSAVVDDDGSASGCLSSVWGILRYRLTVQSEA